MKTINEETRQNTSEVGLASDQNILDLSLIFKLLADPTRLKIINALLRKEMCVQEISELLNMSLPAISHHLKSLRESRLIRYHREGKRALYQIDDELLRSLFSLALTFIASSDKNSSK